MSQSDDLKAEIKKWSNAALKAKMDLHDLAVDLPTGWERILEVAQTAHNAYRTLEAKRESLKVIA